MGCASSMPNDVHTPDVPPDFHNSYILGMKLGRGAFGQVRVATPLKCNSDKQDRAVKILDIRDPEDSEKTGQKLQKDAGGEAKVWLQASAHRNIVKLHEVYFDTTCCYFVMEKCASGLFQHLEAMPEINERSVGSIVAQMLIALSHVHSVGVVHRDVKPDNFLVGGEDGCTVKLADFGLSASVPKNMKLKGSYGTAPFMCPEMLKGKFYDDKADVWSIGVLAYVLLFGDFPYLPKVKNSKAMKQAVVDGKPPKFELVQPCSGQMRSPVAIQFCQQLLDRHPETRPSAEKALNSTSWMVAVADNQHLIEDDLPSLRPMLYAAKKAGAFEVRDLAKESDLDVVLNRLQLETRGREMPQKKTKEVAEADWKSKCSVKSNVWSTGNSWNNASSTLSTTASGTSRIPGSSPPPSQVGSWSPVNSTRA